MPGTHNIAGDGSKESSAARWSVLPDDLLGMVHSRVASLHDRVRFAAVCKSWRAAVSRWPSSPAVPLLLLSPLRHHTMKHLCGPRGYWDFGAPSKTLNQKFVGFHDGGWVAGVDSRGFAIVNLFSGAEVGLSGELRLTSPASSITAPNLWPNNIEKIIFSQAPTTRGRILAAITHHGFNVALSKIDCPKSGWTTKYWHDKVVVDIAFCNGDLYGLMYPGEKLIKFKIDMKGESVPAITNTYQLAIQRREGPTWEDDRVTCVHYLFELHGQLAMAVRTYWLPKREHFFKVFELVDADAGDTYKHKWREVTCFGDYALFLGPTGSKAVYVSLGGHHSLKKNHIYYALPASSEGNMLPYQLAYSVTLGNRGHMFCKEDQSVGDGVGRTGYYVMGCDNSATWLQHADF